MNYSFDKLTQDLKDIKIQGSSQIAKITLETLGQLILKKNYSESADIFFDYATLKNKLLRIRPTEPMLENGFYFLEKHWPKNQNLLSLKKEINKVIRKYLFLINRNQEKIIKFSNNLIKNQEKIFTHCHSSLVEKILTAAKKSGKFFSVYNTETRPLFQGRITAKNLIRNQIKTTLVADSAAGFLISHYSGRELMMDKVIIGADAIYWDGSVVNKIGSFGIGLAAYHEQVPLYITTTLLKLDRDNKIKIEIREKKEIWPQAPKKLKIINFAFDLVPAKFITGIICEFGIIRPSQVKDLVEKNYPWLLKK